MANSEINIPQAASRVDFSDTKNAFAHKTDSELKKTGWLFRMMNKPWLVQSGSTVALWLNEAGIGILNPIIRQTIFPQFCGGISLEASQKAVEHLRQNNTKTVLDYGAEGKTTEEEFDKTLQENIRAIRFAFSHPSVPVISSKLTALVANELLEKKQSGRAFTTEESAAFDRFRNRVDQLCNAAKDNGVAVYIDAEETWLQDPIDEIVKDMMEKYNRDKVVVYHTYQMYRKDKWDDLLEDHREAVAKGYLLGAKIVRGAYMEKERKRAHDMGYPSPIQETKTDTDRDFNKAIQYCIDHYDQIAVCNATHNLKSSQLGADLIMERGLPKEHPHLYFCQLYGMSDNITFNLATAGFNVAKILPYGPVREVVPYLIRRARENTSITGEMSRELELITTEMKRRGLK